MMILTLALTIAANTRNLAPAVTYCDYYGEYRQDERIPETDYYITTTEGGVMVYIEDMSWISNGDRDEIAGRLSEAWENMYENPVTSNADFMERTLTAIEEN